ncbi:MAG: exodeoxyribonuclease I [Natronospirillum sp.]|uniref:exodeoxyribonuclease I n=1 Tax=Natronospirillum sp. TaxID=2812955 RepID=UPI0025E1E9DD|nr:exodeoxyribonuclease I [Natronospirillum sp.]MCH8552484.1 exodeoxyribonuclease I [Natronospirillum sp.]
MTHQSPSFLWYDFETFGVAPRRDRPAQFAAIRTDLELNPIGEPMNWLCQPGPELVPSPDACMITGLTPQHCASEGMPEPEFARRILGAMSQPQTCSAGYNSIRFDDEVSRFLFYRNLLPVYDREWRDGNSRWDLLDVVRLTYALRPEGINWPVRDEGQPSFRLEHLSAANGLDHGQAHDALSDVQATIGLAKLIRSRQPKLFDWALRCRDKAFVKSQIPVLQHKPFVHVSGMLPARHGCLTLLMPLGFHPTNRNEIICFDLQHDPALLNDLTAEEIRRRLFTPTDELGAGERLPVKSVHANKAPMVAPLSLFTEDAAARLGLDRAAMLRNAQTVPNLQTVWPHLQEALQREEQTLDAEQALYQGFIADRDRDHLQQLHGTPSADWGQLAEPSEPRLRTLWRRFIIRHGNSPVPESWQQEWQQYLLAALSRNDVGCALSLAEARERTQVLQAEHPDHPVLKAVEDFLTRQAAQLATLKSR